MLDSKWFIIVMMLLSALMAYASIKRLQMSMKDARKDLSDSRVYAERMGKYAVLLFSSFTVILTIAYVAAAGRLGLLPIIIVYVLVGFKMLALMIEYGALQGTWGYGKKSFAFDKIQCWINLATVVTVILRFFTVGLIVL